MSATGVRARRTSQARWDSARRPRWRPIRRRERSSAWRGSRDQLESGILANIPQVRINGDAKQRLTSTSNLEISYVEGEGFVIAMDLKGVACSTGAACSSGSLEPSHVMSAIRRTADQARSSIRFSLSRFNTTEDIQYTLEILPGVVERLRSLSPRYRKPVAV